MDFPWICNGICLERCSTHESVKVCICKNVWMFYKICVKSAWKLVVVWWCSYEWFSKKLVLKKRLLARALCVTSIEAIIDNCSDTDSMCTCGTAPVVYCTYSISNNHVYIHSSYIICLEFVKHFYIISNIPKNAQYNFP